MKTLSHTAWVWISFLQMANFASSSKPWTFFEHRLMVYYTVHGMCLHKPICCPLVLCNRENERMHKSPVPLGHCREHAWVEPQLDVPWNYSLGKDPLSTRWQGNGVSVPLLTLLRLSSGCTVMPLCLYWLLVQWLFYQTKCTE